MGLIPCDEAAHIHTNSLLNLEVWESAVKDRKSSLTSNISASIPGTPTSRSMKPARRQPGIIAPEARNGRSGLDSDRSRLFNTRFRI
jgi:hypothetical protein